MRKKIWLLSLVLSFVCFATAAQSVSINKAATDAFLITRMAAKYHVQPPLINDQFSENMFGQLFNLLDPQRVFITGTDIKALQTFKLQLDDEIKNKKTDFLGSLIPLYQKRLQMADTMIDAICKKPFNFWIAEAYTIEEDSSFPADEALMRVKLYKLMKKAVLDRLILSDTIRTLPAANQKKYIQALEPSLRKKIQATFQRYIKRVLQSPGGIEQKVSTLYCQAVASCFDPHSAYMTASMKDDFESGLGKDPFQFGFQMEEDDNGNLVIDELKPGSPAYQSGRLNSGDKIQTIQWQGKEPIDVSNASVQEINTLLKAGGNQDKIILTVKKADGTAREVTLYKERMESDEADKVKSFILKGNKTIGYISLPAFYTDWENGSNNINGCANNVAKEIVKLKNEKIDGLILDLRYNGGGSMQEAIELIGIFIDAGPVGQVKSREGKIVTLKDINRGTIYDGPLLVMVNGYSASASEMVAGTLQDYNRAVIAGSNTYGKATAQQILPMDTTIDLNEAVATRQTDSYIKLTISSLYRVNGSSAQRTGVAPHITIPDILELNPEREEQASFALATKPIEANKYYKPGSPLALDAVSIFAKQQIAGNKQLQEIQQLVSEAKKPSQQKSQSLLITDALNQTKAISYFQPPTNNPLPDKAEKTFTIKNNAYEEQRLKSDPNLQEMNEEWKSFMLIDPQLLVAFNVLQFMIK
jgi:carboxyl-terminal processing protease